MDKQLDDVFNSMERDTLAEVMSVSLGSSATSLSGMVNCPVKIASPILSLISMARFREEYSSDSLVASVNYNNGLTGENLYIFKLDDASLIASLMMGMDFEKGSTELSEIEMSALSEAMNLMMGSVATAISNFLSSVVEVSPPSLTCTNFQGGEINLDGIGESEPVLKLDYSLEVGDFPAGRFFQILPVSFAKKITSTLLQGYMEPDEIAALIGEEDKLDGLLDEDKKDALAEVGNISLGAAATALSQLVNRKVEITAPRVTLVTMEEVRESYPLPCLVVTVNYVKGLNGVNLFIIKEEDALVIVGLMMGMEPPQVPAEMGELEISGISEAMNQMMGSSATAMAELFHRQIDISTPKIAYMDLKNESLKLEDTEDDTAMIQIAFRMVVDGSLDSELLQLIPVDYGNETASFLLDNLANSAQVLQDPSGSDIWQETPFDQAAAALSEEVAIAEAAKIYTETPLEAEFFYTGEGHKFQNTDEKKDYGLRQEEYEKINLIKDIAVEISVILGRTRLPLKKIFSLHPGDVLSMDHYLGEPVELFANERLVARGEVVLVNGQFGVKIIEMVRS
ncbi:MAG: flagellar motor switch phosphatase FliY [Bacillota bacterium]|nr:flagellar motor switch phosphatase FliY [Bacillota bacterium]